MGNDEKNTYVKAGGVHNPPFALLLPCDRRGTQLERRMRKPPTIIVIIVRRIAVIRLALHLLCQIMCELRSQISVNHRPTRRQTYPGRCMEVIVVLVHSREVGAAFSCSPDISPELAIRTIVGLTRRILGRIRRRRTRIGLIDPPLCRTTAHSRRDDRFATTKKA